MVRRTVVSAFLGLLLVPASALAQNTHKPLPITTGTTTQRMDAPETNNQLEQYAHAPIVQSIGHKLGLSTAQAARYFEDFNSFVLIAVILFFFFRIVPGKFRAKREHLRKDLVEARETTAEAERRLRAIEDRLSALGGEVDALRSQAAASMDAEEARMHAAMEEERKRIVRTAEADIEAAQASAQRGLRRFAANLTLDRAASKVQTTPESDRMLTEELLASLAADGSLRGRN